MILSTNDDVFQDIKKFIHQTILFKNITKYKMEALIDKDIPKAIALKDIESKLEKEIFKLEDLECLYDEIKELCNED